MAAHAEHGRVLLVDDDAMSRLLAAESLRHAGFEVSEADRGEDALNLFDENSVDLLLLDVMMPGLDGYAVCERIRRHAKGQWLPILMLTGLNDTDSIERAYAAGATDFITKPINWLLLTQRVRYGLRASHAMAAVTRSQQSLAHAQRKVEGFTQDITERVQAQRRIQHLAMHDALTGLANRQFFAEMVCVELERAQRVGSSCALLHLDIDHFKSVNDALGDAVGDQLLCAVAERLRASLRGADLLALNLPLRAAEMVARIDGDAFTVLVMEVRRPSHAAMVAERLLQATAQPLLLDGRELVLTASVGVAVFPRDGDSVEALWRHAEQAMYAAKETGPATYRFFDEEMNTVASAKLALESDLRRAIVQGDLRLHFQPKVDAASSRMIGAEALVRWQHPQRGLLGPAEFIPLAEETGMIVALGDWVVAAAARQLRDWADAGLEPVRVSINLASPSFQQADIADKLCATVRRAGVLPQQLLLELTESLLMSDVERTVASLNALRDKGFGLSLDDFGTGYSSLSYLHRFPIDELKIDRAFVTHVARGSKDAAIALSIIELGKQFGMRVVAEGVETRDQAGFLLAHRCPIQQGFLFSRPLPVDRFEALLRTGGVLDVL